jgi:hypothetical protein
MGVPVLKKVKRKHLNKILGWVDSPEKISVEYTDVAQAAVKRAMDFLH